MSQQSRILVVVEGQAGNRYEPLHATMKRLAARRILRCAWVVDGYSLEIVRGAVVANLPYDDRWLICEMGAFVERLLRERIV